MTVSRRMAYTSIPQGPSRRTGKMGWPEGILSITIIPGEDGKCEEALIEKFGELTRLEQVMMSQHLYIDDQVDLHKTRKCCRNSYMCLMASLTSKAKKKVSIWSNQYRIGKNNEGSSGALHKVIIRESHLDAKAKTNQVRT